MWFSSVRFSMICHSLKRETWLVIELCEVAWCIGNCSNKDPHSTHLVSEIASSPGFRSSAFSATREEAFSDGEPAQAAAKNEVTSGGDSETRRGWRGVWSGGIDELGRKMVVNVVDLASEKIGRQRAEEIKGSSPASHCANAVDTGTNKYTYTQAYT